MKEKEKAAIEYNYFVQMVNSFCNDTRMGMHLYRRYNDFVEKQGVIEYLYNRCRGLGEEGSIYQSKLSDVEEKLKAFAEIRGFDLGMSIPPAKSQQPAVKPTPMAEPWGTLYNLEDALCSLETIPDILEGLAELATWSGKEGEEGSLLGLSQLVANNNKAINAALQAHFAAMRKAGVK